MRMETYVCLDDLHFFAYHGVAPQETMVGNEMVWPRRKPWWAMNMPCHSV